MRTSNGQLIQWTSERRTVVHEADTKDLLAQAGIPIPRRNPQSGACVVKLCSDRYPHKSEHGLVKLNVPAAQTDAVGAEMRSRDTAGVLLVEEMIADGIAEWIVGCRHDSTFGPIVVVGVGGVLVELLNEVKVRLAPTDFATALAAIQSQRAGKALAGLRGNPSGDIKALATIVSTASNFFSIHSELIEQMEINPVIVRPAGQGAVAADALMILRSRIDLRP